MDKAKATEILDGTMLGDGNISRQGYGARYRINLSKPLVPRSEITELARAMSLQEHLKYEQWLIDKAFTPLGIQVGDECPKVRNSVSKGKPYKYASLTTLQSPVLLDLYNEWYAGGELVGYKAKDSYIRGATKNLPERIMNANTIPIATLVHWFLGDGGSSWMFSRWSDPQVRISFSTRSFTEQEVYHLRDIINNMGIVTIKLSIDEAVEKGAGLAIWLSSATDNINCFMDLVEPLMFEIFGNPAGPSYMNMVKRKSKRFIAA